MRKDIKDYTIEEILDEYDDIVEQLKIGEYYKNDDAIANMIRAVIMREVDRDDHERILDIIVKIKDEEMKRETNRESGNGSLLCDKRFGLKASKERKIDVIIKEFLKNEQFLEQSRKNYGDYAYLEETYDESIGPDYTVRKKTLN